MNTDDPRTFPMHANTCGASRGQPADGCSPFCTKEKKAFSIEGALRVVSDPHAFLHIDAESLCSLFFREIDQEEPYSDGIGADLGWYRVTFQPLNAPMSDEERRARVLADIRNALQPVRACLDGVSPHHVRDPQIGAEDYDEMIGDARAGISRVLALLTHLA